MSDYSIEISPHSKIIIFQGTLKKAPQLNKRGRKKWKDRFIVLRACKTLECFKSKKALDSSKSPRKVIDIRECINLEVGLEYKELQHIFSLGTFKRSFFFAAPSDALMLQWVDNIEKVKNALHGDRVRILDIGLRKSPMRTLTSSTAGGMMSGSQSMSRLAQMCSSNTAINQIGSVSTISRDFMSDGERSPSLPPPSHQAMPHDHTHSFTSSSSSSSGSSPSHKRSVTDDTSPAHRRGHYYVNVAPVKKGKGQMSPHISPEHNTMPTATHISGSKSQNGRHVYEQIIPEHLVHKSFEEKEERGENSDITSSLQREGISLPSKPHPQTLPLLSSCSPKHSHPVTKSPGKIPPPKIASRGNLNSPTHSSNTCTHNSDSVNPFTTLLHNTQQIEDSSTCSRYPSNTGNSACSGNEGSLATKGGQSSHQGMRRSFRYRKITLRKEKPMFGNIHEEEEDEEESSDETDRETSIERGVVVPPALATPLPPSSLLYQKRSIAKSSPNLSEIGRPKAGRVKNIVARHENIYNQDDICEQKHVHVRKHEHRFIPPPPPRKGSVPLLGGGVPLLRGMAPLGVMSDCLPNYSKVTVVGVKVANVTSETTSTCTSQNEHRVSVEKRSSGKVVSRGSSLRNSSSDGALCSPVPPENIYLPDPLSDDEDDICLPVRYSSGQALDSISVNSLDELLVEPPLMFNEPTNNSSNSGSNSGNIEEENKDTMYTKKADNIPNGTEDKEGEVEEISTAYRSSTESCDTGYTGSPTIGKWSPEISGKCLSHSSSSSSSLTERTCIPLVFYSKNIWKPRLLKSSDKGEGLVSVQVCLVEQSRGLMADFLSLKSLEGYTQVDSEVEQGPSSVTTPTSEVMTVETSLEDLEFGFKIVKSSQKELFQKKVKVFDFEVENLFNKKLFSCDVHICCHGDTVLIPIEFELN